MTDAEYIADGYAAGRDKAERPNVPPTSFDLMTDERIMANIAYGEAMAAAVENAAYRVEHLNTVAFLRGMLDRRAELR